MPQPLFVSFEGIDGCGKTTQLTLLAERLRAEGREVVTTFEPGGTDTGNAIRALLLNSRSHLDPSTELLLFFASRAQNVAEVIVPALRRSAVVLCDRFTDSTVVYQGAGRGFDVKSITDLNLVACGALIPDLTLLLDIDAELSVTRARVRTAQAGSGETRMEQECLPFFERVRAAYLKLAATDSSRVRLVDARASIATVAGSVWEQVRPHVR